MCASWEYVNIETQLWNDSLFDNFYGFGRKPSKKLSLVKIWTVFPPQISCMARIVSCRLMMKVTVMPLLSSITMFSLLAQNFQCLTSLFKKTQLNNLCAQYTTRLSGDAGTKRLSPPDLHVSTTQKA